MEQQAKSVEQYKQEMLAQARRNNVQVAAPAPVERVLEKAEPIVEAVEPFAKLALRSGLASAGAAMAAKGLELGVEALESHIEKKKAEHAPPPPAPPAPPAPPPTPAVDVNIDFSPQIAQEAPVVVAPTVTAPAVAAPTVTVPSIVAPAVAEVTVAAAPPPPPPPSPPPPPPAPPPITPAPLPAPPPVIQMPVPVPLPPVIFPVWPPTAPPPPAISIPPAPMPVAVPLRPAPEECETVTCTVKAAPCRAAPCMPASKPPARHSCPIHNPCRQSCCASRKPAPRSCSCKTPRSPQAESASWFMQPAVEAAYAAYTAGLMPEDAAGETMFAYGAPEAVPAAAMPDVAYAGQAASPQSGYYELPAQDYASLEDYLARNTARGILELQVRVASDDAAPVQGANVDVMRTIAGVTYLFFHGVTDANGNAGRIALPAPERSLSFAPPHGFVPYAVYTVSVTHGDYAPQVFENVTVFPDTESVQVVRLGLAAAPFAVDEGRYVM